MKPARTRFAPSPTGFLHVGGVRTALFNYLYAKKTGGEFVLRLEDTDRERFVAAGVEQIVESLAWLGLKPDEGFWISESRHHSIEYVQSERQKRGIYQQYADQLVNDGLAYHSYITPEAYAELKNQDKSGPFVYKKSMEAEHHTDTPPAGNYPIRLDTEAVRGRRLQDQIEWQDEIRGTFSADLSLMEDFILIKSDGFPTYNFANVIDDHEMQITHIIRGDEFISSSGKHALLYKLFGWEPPRFVHLPVINGPDGKKLSKRTGDTNTLEYRDKGYLPEALLNFLALLGWNDGSTQEIYSLEELAQKFDLKGINSSPAVFDQRRLDWVNGYWIREKLPLDELYERSKSFWPETAQNYDKTYRKQVLAIIRERLKYFTEIPELTRFFFEDLMVNPELISGHKQLKKMPASELKDLLEQAKASLEASDFGVPDLTERLNQLLEQTGQKPVVLFSLIRIATTQAPASPGLADTLAVLGKERSLKRIDKQLYFWRRPGLTPNIVDELLRRSKAEQTLRIQWDANDTEEFRLKVLAQDKDNTAFLKKIVETSGWPKISEVGHEAAKAAWLIAQHSPDKTFRKRCLDLMLEIPDEIEPQNLARTIDRVRIDSGERQYFGTHFTKAEDGTWAPMPIEDAETVNVRRAEYGLQTIEEKIKEYNQD